MNTEKVIMDCTTVWAAGCCKITVWFTVHVTTAWFTVFELSDLLYYNCLIYCITTVWFTVLQMLDLQCRITTVCWVQLESSGANNSSSIQKKLTP